MEIRGFLEKLKGLKDKAVMQTELVENNGKNRIETMAELVQMIEAILPEWFFFIDQTEIGSKDEILLVLKDIQKGSLAEDSVYLADVLWNGLRRLAMAYIDMIEEALDGE